MNPRPIYLLESPQDIEALVAIKNEYLTVEKLKPIAGILSELKKASKLTTLKERHIGFFSRHLLTIEHIIPTLKLFIIILQKNGDSVDDDVLSLLSSMEAKHVEIQKKIEALVKDISTIKESNSVIANNDSTQLQRDYAQQDLDKIQKSKSKFLLVDSRKKAGSLTRLIKTSPSQINNSISASVTKLEVMSFVFSVLKPLYVCLQQVIKEPSLQHPYIAENETTIMTITDLARLRGNANLWKDENKEFSDYATVVQSFSNEINGWLLEIINNYPLLLPQEEEEKKVFTEDFNRIKACDASIGKNELFIPFHRVMSREAILDRYENDLELRHKSSIEYAKEFLNGIDKLNKDIDSFENEISTLHDVKKAKAHYRQGSMLLKNRINIFRSDVSKSSKDKKSLDIQSNESKPSEETLKFKISKAIFNLRAAKVDANDETEKMKIESLIVGLEKLPDIQTIESKVKLAEEKLNAARANIKIKYPEVAVKPPLYKFFSTPNTPKSTKGLHAPQISRTKESKF